MTIASFLIVIRNFFVIFTKHFIIAQLFSYESWIMENLQNKTIFLTGACGGLGSSLALALCQAGADVIVSDKNPRSLNVMCDKIVEHGGKEPLVYPLDLTGSTPDDFLKIAEAIEENLGKLDSIIHTAVEFAGLTTFEQYSPTRWLKEMQINLNSPIFLTQALIPLLKESKGSVIFTLDDEETMKKAYWGGYGTSKGAIKQFAHILQQELENSCVRVETVTPPPMKTQLRSKAWPAEDTNHLQDPADATSIYMDLI